MRESGHTAGKSDLQGLFAPRHVAIIGASSTPGKIGNIVVSNLIKGGFAGRISPVNASGTAVEGLAGYRNLADIAAAVDVAFIVVPAASVVEAVRQCAAAGVAYVVVGASGFAELGDAAGMARQEDIARIARERGMRLIGPNTNGILSTTDRLPLGYNASHAESMTPGPVSVISHSGALFDAVSRRLRGFGSGLAKFIPVGNEADLDMLDFFEWLIEDPATSVIGLVVEGLADGARFRRLAVRSRRAGKPVVALKIGRSAAGASAALAHSARLAGRARAYQALFREAGVASVPTVEGLAGACALLAAQPGRLHDDRRLVCITSSGAGGALLVDVASERGLTLAAPEHGGWPAEIDQALRRLPSAAPIRHPIDLGSLGDWSLLSPVLDELEAAGFRGPLLAYSHIAPQPAMTEALFTALQQRREAGRPVLLLAPGGLSEAVEARYRAAGIPVFADTACCFDSLGALYAARLAEEPDLPAPPAADPVRQAELRAALADADGPVLSELKSAQVLRRMGIPVVRSVEIASLSAAEAAAAELGFPLVLKAMVPGIAHKNDNGLVVVGIADLAQLRAAYASLHTRAAALAGGATAALIVQPFHAARAEVILGLSSEGSLGDFLVAGFGGLQAELLDEVVLLPIPLSSAVMRVRLAESRVGGLLRAVAGAAVVDQVVHALDCLQTLALEQPGRILSVDINPLLITKSGCIAVDALVILPAVRAAKE